jgi:hypothetical protein
MRCLVLAATVAFAFGHGAMVTPRSRNSVDYLLGIQFSRWGTRTGQTASGVTTHARTHTQKLHVQAACSVLRRTSATLMEVWTRGVGCVVLAMLSFCTFVLNLQESRQWCDKHARTHAHVHKLFKLHAAVFRDRLQVETAIRTHHDGVGVDTWGWLRCVGHAVILRIRIESSRVTREESGSLCAKPPPTRQLNHPLLNEILICATTLTSNVSPSTSSQKHRMPPTPLHLCCDHDPNSPLRRFAAESKHVRSLAVRGREEVYVVLNSQSELSECNLQHHDCSSYNFSCSHIHTLCMHAPLHLRRLPPSAEPTAHART